MAVTPLLSERYGSKDLTNGKDLDGFIALILLYYTFCHFEFNDLVLGLLLLSHLTRQLNLSAIRRPLGELGDRRFLRCSCAIGDH